MQTFLNFILEQEEEGAKLKHIHHAEDRPLFHGAEGYKHAHEALTKAHEHTVNKKNTSDLTMKYDGSPSIVFGHHPTTKKFFVASKSAFNKSPKINYSHEDVDKNHGHAPGLAHKLKTALDHLHKVTPKKGVYQGDVLHTPEDHKHHKNGNVSFTPNTITYTAKGKEAEAVKKSKIGVAVHTKYHGTDIHNMSAHHDVDAHNFHHNSDVHLKSAEHDTAHVHYPEKAQAEFHKHMKAAETIHKTHGSDMYKATEKHHGTASHLATYVNHTVKTDEKPSAEGFKKHLTNVHDKLAAKLKTKAGQDKRHAEGAEHVAHVEHNKDHYNNLLKMHQHLQKAKDTLVKHLETHEGGLEHHIEGKKSKPEGFVVHHANEPTKLVNRKEFAKANLLKVRK
jgi:hypothetical protein